MRQFDIHTPTHNYVESARFVLGKQNREGGQGPLYPIEPGAGLGSHRVPARLSYQVKPPVLNIYSGLPCGIAVHQLISLRSLLMKKVKDRGFEIFALGCCEDKRDFKRKKAVLWYRN